MQGVIEVLFFLGTWLVLWLALIYAVKPVAVKECAPKFQSWAFDMCPCGSGFWMIQGNTRYHTLGDKKRAQKLCETWNSQK